MMIKHLVRLSDAPRFLIAKHAHELNQTAVRQLPDRRADSRLARHRSGTDSLHDLNSRFLGASCKPRRHVDTGEYQTDTDEVIYRQTFSQENNCQQGNEHWNQIDK